MLKNILLISMCDQKRLDTTALESFKYKYLNIN